MKKLISKRNKLFPTFLFLLLLQAYSGPLSSQQVVWIGGVGDWDISSNWSTGNLPSFSDSVAINIATDVVTIKKGFSARSYHLDMIMGSTLNIEELGRINFIDGSKGIINNGTINCAGTINMRKPDSNGINNQSDGNFTIADSGLINVDTCAGGAIVNNGIFENNGWIDIDSSSQIGIHHRFGDFENNGLIHISRVAEEGINNQRFFVNTDTILLININERGISSQLNFSNNQSGFIGINNAKEEGIYNSKDFSNSGQIAVSNIKDDGILNTEFFSNSGFILIDSIEGHGVSNQDMFINELDGIISISNIDQDGFHNAAVVSSVETLVNHGEIHITNTRVGLENEYLLENHGLLEIIKTNADGIDNYDSIYNSKLGLINISLVHENFKWGIRNEDEETSIINNGMITIDSCAEGISSGLITNNRKISISKVGRGFNIINKSSLTNSDSIIIDKAQDGINVLSIEEDFQLINRANGNISISNTENGITISRGEVINDGFISVESASEKGLWMLNAFNNLEPGLLMNNNDAIITIFNSGDVGIKIEGVSECISASGSLIHIMNTLGIPIEIGNTGIADFKGEVVIQD